MITTYARKCSNEELVSVRIDGTGTVPGPDTGLVSGMRLGSDTGELLSLSHS